MAKREGFKLHKFTYNNEGVAEQIPMKDRAENRDKQQMEHAKGCNVPHVRRLQRFQNLCYDDIREHGNDSV